MLRLALSGCSNYVVDDREIRRGDVSFTVNTFEELAEEYPGAELLLIMGSDSWETIPLWRDPKRLLQLAIPAVVQRAGDKPLDLTVADGLVDSKRCELIGRHVIEMPLIEISSGEMRSRIATGRSIRFRTTRAVEAFIHAEGLYRREPV